MGNVIYTEDFLSKVNLEPLAEAVSGEEHGLFGAFTWEDSPQGFDFWDEQSLGDKPLDLEELKNMLAQAKGYQLEVNKGE